MEQNLRSKTYPKMVKENGKMRAKITQLEEELGIVKWYMEVMESGVDTTELTKEYTILKR